MKMNKKTFLVRIAIIILSVGLLLIGIRDRGFQDVKNKAVRICYECIGIG